MKLFKAILSTLGFLAALLVFYSAMFIGLQVHPGLANVFLALAALMLAANIVAAMPRVPWQARAAAGILVFGIFVYAASVQTGILIAEQRSLQNAYDLDRERLSPGQWRALERFYPNDPHIIEMRRRAEEELEALDREVRARQQR